MKRKLLLIGGTGFLGSHLLPLLMEANHDITILTRDTEKAASLKALGVNCIHGDILQPEKFIDQCNGFEVIVNIAMPPFKPGPTSKRKFNRLREATTVYVKNSLLLARKCDCPLILTYGTSFEIKENEVADESFPIARRGMAKAGEYVDEIIKEVKRKGDIPMIEMLPGQIYGAGGLSLKMIQMAKNGKAATFGDGSNRIPRIHVDDCAAAYASVISLLPLNNRFILADDYACTMKEFNDYIGQHYGVTKQRKIPTGIFKLIAGKMIYETVTMDCVVTNAKAKNVLGWQLRYPTFREGLDATFPLLDEMEKNK